MLITSKNTVTQTTLNMQKNGIVSRETNSCKKPKNVGIRSADV